MQFATTALRKVASAFKLNVRLTPAAHRIADSWVPARGPVFEAQAYEAENDLTRRYARAPGRSAQAMRAGDIGKWRTVKTSTVLPEATEAPSTLGRTFAKVPGRVAAVYGPRNDNRVPAKHMFIAEAAEGFSDMRKALGSAA